MASIHDAVLQGNLPQVQQLLADHAGLLEARIDREMDIGRLRFAGTGSTPLILSAYKGNQAMLEHLLRQGASINAKDRYGYDALLRACQCGYLGLVTILLNNGAKLYGSRTNHGFTPLMTVAFKGYYEIAALLLHHARQRKTEGSLQALVNARRTDSRRTALYYSCFHGYAEITKLLLMEGGADPTMGDHLDRPPLAIAIQRNHPVCVSLLQVRQLISK